MTRIHTVANFIRARAWGSKISRVLFSLFAANRCGEFRCFSRETILGAMAMLDQLELPWRPSRVGR